VSSLVKMEGHVIEKRRKMNDDSKSGGISLLTFLFLMFLFLKLTGHITWSWWWVTSPLWLPWGIVISLVTIIMLTGLIAKLIKK